MKLSTKDYKKILKFYGLSIPKKSENIKKKADKIIAKKFCSCIKKVQQKFREEGIAIGICTNSVITRKGYKRGKFKCKKRRTINLHKGGKRKKKTRKKRGKGATISRFFVEPDYTWNAEQFDGDYYNFGAAEEALESYMNDYGSPPHTREYQLYRLQQQRRIIDDFHDSTDRSGWQGHLDIARQAMFQQMGNEPQLPQARTEADFRHLIQNSYSGNQSPGAAGGGKRNKKTHKKKGGRRTRKKRGKGGKFSKPKEDTTAIEDTTVIEGRNAWTEDDLEVWIGDTLDAMAQKPHAKGFREIINTPFLHQYIASFLLDHTKGMDFNKAFFSKEDKSQHKQLMNYRLVKVLNEIPLKGHPTYKLFKTYLEEKKKNMFLNLFNEWTVLGPSSTYHNPRGSMHKGAGLEKSRYLRMLFNIMYEVVKQAHAQKHRQNYYHSINVRRWYYREQDPDTYDRILDAIRSVTVKPPNMREEIWNEIWRRNGLNEDYAKMPYLNIINNFRWLIQPGFLKYWKWYGKFKQKLEAQKGSIPLRGKYKEESMNEGEILSKILIMTLFQYLHHYKELFIYDRMIDQPSPATKFPTFEHERKVDRRSLERFTELILLLINSPQINWNKSFNTNVKHKKTGKLMEYTYKDIYTFWLDFVEKFKEVKAKEMKLYNENARKRFLKGINPITNFRRNYFRVTVVLMEEEDLEPIVMITKLIHEKTYPQEKKTARELDIDDGTYDGDDEQKLSNGGGKTPRTSEMNPKNSPQHIPPLVLPPSITVDSAEVEDNSMEQIFLHNLSVSIIGLQNPNTILEILQLYQNDYNGRIADGIQPSGNFGELLNNDIQALQNYINYLQSQQSGGCFPNCEKAKKKCLGCLKPARVKPLPLGVVMDNEGNIIQDGRSSLGIEVREGDGPINIWALNRRIARLISEGKQLKKQIKEAESPFQKGQLQEIFYKKKKEWLEAKTQLLVEENKIAATPVAYPTEPVTMRR